MTDKIRSLDADFVFGEIDTEAMLRDKINRLTERCAMYKGQVEAGAHEIDRLTAERDEWRERYLSEGSNRYWEGRWRDATAENERLREVAAAAEAFRSAMIENGALAQIPQSRYFAKLRGLEIALAAFQQDRP